MITKEIRYALRSLVYMAIVDGRPVTLEEVSKAENISKNFLRKIFHCLKHNGFVTSIRGKYGGYVLSRPPSEIYVYEIIACHNEGVLVDCPNEDCVNYSHCHIKDFWNALNESFIKLLKRITIADIVDKTYTFPEITLTDKLATNNSQDSQLNIHNSIKE
ncbi:RrF2 family transcriptional regulator [Kosmotoga pacifica]|uniref:RrF2 family transcriptional regulator n=1 Tax=Kosmotoga pacifica TaxID=1330330 RepID=UPI00069A908E|nr:Rrf2 family transcriptional regulator [Kosmotoga pacifica]